jgi:hypothetical protein
VIVASAALACPEIRLPVGCDEASIADTGPDTVVVLVFVFVFVFVDTELEQTWLRSARVPANTFPVGAEIPSSAKWRAWNLLTARFVAGPNVEVSIPGDPAPDSATCVCGYMLSTFWRFITSTPREPLLTFVLNVLAQLIVGRLRAADAEIAPAAIPPMIATDVAIFIENLDINFMFIRF